MRDLIIIGGGPAGLATGRMLADAGFDVVLYEEHPSSGEPVHCTGVLATEAFDDFSVPRHVVLNPLRTVRFYAPCGASVAHTTDATEAVVVDRAALDRALFAEAQHAGVDVVFGSRVCDVAINPDSVRITLSDGSTVRGRACVLACGAHYAIQRRIGLGLPPVFLQSAQVELPARTLQEVEVRFGVRVAPGGFAWTVPVMRPSGPHARVGLMCGHDVGRHFDRFLEDISAHWGIDASDGSGTPVIPRQKMLPLAPIPRTFANRVLAVGDAAGLVKATTGGGIYYSLLSAAIAGDVLTTALRSDRLDAGALGSYEDAWKAKLGAELKAQLRLRTLSERLTDSDIDVFIDLARTNGVMPILRQTARFNKHRDFIVSLLRHPASRRVLLGRLRPEPVGGGPSRVIPRGIEH